MRTPTYLESGWIGKEVRSADGRFGVIKEAIQAAWSIDLYIASEDGSVAKVTLNARGPDSGDHTWQWYCPNFCHGPAWLPLTEQSPVLEYERRDA
jgi:hypothetical protein